MVTNIFSLNSVEAQAIQTYFAFAIPHPSFNHPYVRSLEQIAVAPFDSDRKRASNSNQKCAATCNSGNQTVSRLEIASEVLRSNRKAWRAGGGEVNWINDRVHDLRDLGSAGWLAIAAWVALALGIVVLVWANRQMTKNRQLKAEQVRPQVTMYMEPHASDWHVIELVVRNFGQTAAHDVRFDFVDHPTVAAYEDVRFGGVPEVAELDLPSELTYLAPGQEWRTVWDSAISRAELGGSIRDRFDGSLTYSDRPRPDSKSKSRSWGKGQAFATKFRLDWGNLQPVQRIELMTTHDLAKREKQKLELLRSVLSYFHYASKEAQPDVFRAEIDRMTKATAEVQDRWRSRQFDQTTELDFPWNQNGQAGRHSAPMR